MFILLADDESSGCQICRDPFFAPVVFVSDEKTQLWSRQSVVSAVLSLSYADYLQVRRTRVEVEQHALRRGADAKRTEPLAIARLRVGIHVTNWSYMSVV